MTVTNRRGVTLTEIIVVTVVIGLVVGLVTVAVQMARESARRMQCSNNLRQLGIAVHSANEFPSLKFSQRLVNGTRRMVCVSPHYQLLGELEQHSLLNESLPSSILFDAHLSGGYTNDWFRGVAVGVFKCPSDGVTLGTNYRFVTGPDAYSREVDAINEGGKGPFILGRSAQNMSNLSQVIIVSERRVSGIKIDVQADIWLPMLVPPYTHHPTTFLVSVGRIAVATPPTSLFRSAGHNWLRPEYAFTLYNHSLLPNDKTSVSLIASDNDSFGATVNATSFHRGGVNCLRGDGSVDFYTDRVDLHVWRQLATVEK